MFLDAISKTLICCIAYLAISDATHFRGGSVSWRYVNTTGENMQVEINYHFGWRLNYTRGNQKEICNDTHIKARTPLYSDGKWNVANNLESVDISDKVNSIMCTTFDTGENWAYGHNSFLISASRMNLPFQIEYSGGDWISNLVHGSGSNWSLKTTIDLGIRSDTGKVNNPPSTSRAPIIRVKIGCPKTIKISFIDEDNDKVTCRYAKPAQENEEEDDLSNEDECGDICKQEYKNFDLDQENCTIHYDGKGSESMWAVALMLEDHPSQTITLDGERQVQASEPLSKIPLQFIIKVIPKGDCDAAPTYPSDALGEDNKVTVISKSRGLNETLRAYAKNASVRIVRFHTFGIPEAIVSEVSEVGENLYQSTIVWSPGKGQARNYIMCYHAVDSEREIGEAKCVKVKVESDPCDVNNGGCSDTCISQNSSRVCSCSENCWELLDDGQTCAPRMNVSCGGQGIGIVIPNCVSNRTLFVGSKKDFLQPTCLSTLQKSSQVFQFSPSQCGVTTQARLDSIVYEFNVWLWHATDKQSPIITRGEWRKLPTHCSMSAKANATMDRSLNRSFVPILPYNDRFLPDNVVIDGMGAFSFFFNFYKSDSYLDPWDESNYPLEITVNDRMYLSLGAIGEGNFKFFTEECVASTTYPNNKSRINYTFIENGCLNDTTLKQHQSSSLMEQRFSLEAFEFEDKLLSKREDSEILLECKVMLCDAAKKSTRCFQGCQSNSDRRKRSVEMKDSGFPGSIVSSESLYDYNDEQTTESIISESPLQRTNTRIILVRKKPTGTSDGNYSTSDSSEYTNWILIGIGIVILLTIIVVSSLYLANKRRNAKRSKEEIADPNI